MRILFLEARNSTFRLTSPLLLASASIFGVQMLYPAVSSWTNITQALITTSIFSGPFLAAMGAWQGTRVKRLSLESQDGLSSRSQVEIHAARLGAALLWVSLGTATAYLITISWAARVAITGDPVLVALLRPLLTNVFSVTLGYSLGVVLRRWYAVAVAVGVAIALYLLDITASIPQLVSSFSPYDSLDVFGGSVPNVVSFAGKAAVTVALSLFLACLAMFIVERQARLWLSFASLLSLSIMIFGGGLLISQRGFSFSVPEEAEQKMITAKSAEGLVLEVLDLYEPVMPELLAEWTRVSLLFSESGLAFNRLSQDLNPDYGEAPFERPFRLDLNPLSREISATSLDMMFLDITSCGTGAVSPSGDYGFEGDVLFRTWVSGRQDFGSVLMVDTNAQARLDGLFALSPEDARRWVAQNEDNIRACSWDFSDFPPK